MDLTRMTDDEVDALRIAVLVEQERRRLVASAPALEDLAIPSVERIVATIRRRLQDAA